MSKQHDCIYTRLRCIVLAAVAMPTMSLLNASIKTTLSFYLYPAAKSHLSDGWARLLKHAVIITEAIGKDRRDRETERVNDNVSGLP